MTVPVVIGGGIAGLLTALHLAPVPCILLTEAPLGEGGSSALAQGGVAAAVGADDSVASHVADTIAAGDGLCDAETVSRILGDGPGAIDYLAGLGVRFDRDAQGALLLGLEGAHGSRRIVHAEGDATGRAIMRGLTRAVRTTPSIRVLECVAARQLVLRDGAIGAVLAASVPGGEAVLLPTRRVVLATGGIGGLFEHTTNPPGSIGQGLFLAARAGAILADPEFVQFHPTALDAGTRPLPLISEAVRGEGAVLIDETGTRIMGAYGRGELEPRDVVARAVWRHGCAGHRVFLDATRCLGAGFARRFPSIAALCREAGIDPATQPIPVRAAAHYHMGGVWTDGEGRSSVPGLWACGEVAATGLHGANRLASNSLLEAAVTARWVAASVAGAGGAAIPVLSGSIPPAAPDAAAVRPIVTEALGLERTGPTLARAVAMLLPLAQRGSAAEGPAALALIMAVAALGRPESRGAHHRSDAPQLRAGEPTRTFITLADALRAAGALEPVARSA
ncbi:MAG: L-aspartate oxidase [Acetobacteraceae bacterium]|nr:L-aspartate oxidase [Acetobacteraceae bacterium]